MFESVIPLRNPRSGVLRDLRQGDALAFGDRPQVVLHRVEGHVDEFAQVDLLSVEGVALVGHVPVFVDRRNGVRHRTVRCRSVERSRNHLFGNAPASDVEPAESFVAQLDHALITQCRTQPVAVRYRQYGHVGAAADGLDVGLGDAQIAARPFDVGLGADQVQFGQTHERIAQRADRLGAESVVGPVLLDVEVFAPQIAAGALRSVGAVLRLGTVGLRIGHQHALLLVVVVHDLLEPRGWFRTAYPARANPAARRRGRDGDRGFSQGSL